MKTILTLCCNFIFLISCQKELNFDAPAVVSSSCKQCSYVPFCNGSVYVYSDTIGGMGRDVTETINIVKDTTIDGKNYQEFLDGGTKAYYNCATGISTLLAFAVPVPGGNVPRLEQIVLKANSAVGTTWSNSFPVGLGIATFDFRVAAKGLTKSILGVTYNDVTQVHLIIRTTIAGGISAIAGTSDYFYANNIGLVENVSFSSPLAGPPTVIYHRVLKTYSIP